MLLLLQPAKPLRGFTEPQGINSNIVAFLDLEAQRHVGLCAEKQHASCANEYTTFSDVLNKMQLGLKTSPNGSNKRLARMHTY